MAKIDLHDIGFDRCGFLAGSSALLTGALLGASGTEEAQGSQASTAPAVVPESKSDLLSDLLVANYILADQGVVDGYGHVSVRNPENRNHFYISVWKAPDLVTESDIVELDFDCVPVTGDKRKLYSDRFIHSEIYRARPDVNSVVHTHAPTVVLMGVCGDPLVPLYHMTGFIASGVPIFDIRKSFGMTNMLISDAARGKALAQVLGNQAAALMRGHGGVTVGTNLSHAVGRSVYLKVNAELQIQVLGRKVEYLSLEEAHLAEIGNTDFPKDWDLWKRRVMATRKA